MTPFRRRRRLLILVTGLLVAGSFLVLGAMVALHRDATPAGEEAPLVEQIAEALTPRPEVPPLEQWSATFRDHVAAGSWGPLAELLEGVREGHPDRYADEELRLLHARARAESTGEDVGELLAPYLEPGADFHRTALAIATRAAETRGDDGEASQRRRRLIGALEAGPFRTAAIEDELAHLERAGDPRATLLFVESVREGAGRSLDRALDARVVEVFVAQEDLEAALSLGFRLLADGTLDDPANRVARALDTPAVLPLLSAEQLVTLGETRRAHRYFDRAVELLTAARARLPRQRADLDFSIGRAHFFAEDMAAAGEAYRRGAELADSSAQRARFLFHASRAAQLVGDDEGGERLLTAAIAVKGSHAATAAALGNRLRTRVAQGRLDEAGRDLALLRRYFPRDESLREASIAYALGLLAHERPREARSILDSIPRRLLGAYTTVEVAYWRGRSLEDEDPEAAVDEYLAVLRSGAASHFPHFARERLASEALRPLRDARAADLATRVDEAVAAGDWAGARRLQTDVVRLLGRERSDELGRLRRIYQELPAYAEILQAEPQPLPELPLGPGADPIDRLMALGLYDAIPAEVLRDRYPFSPWSAGLTRAVAYARAGQTQKAIEMMEILAQRLPEGYVLELLPREAQELLYPLFFWQPIVAEAARHGADPRLVLSIMREESRFDPRARSAAAARGLLQFVITTAQQVAASLGWTPIQAEDLYHPPTIIQLGAKYVGDLLGELEGDPYATAAAYNAGPLQARLWQRWSPAPGADYFASTVHFEETEHYVRKVLNSYVRYGEVYGEELGRPPAPPTTVAAR